MGMMDERMRAMEVEEMKEYNEWFEEIAEFAMIQFDRSKMQRFSWRDFRALARYDSTIQNILKTITPLKEEYECFKYAVAIKRKNAKKKSKKEKKNKLRSKQSQSQSVNDGSKSITN